MGCEDPLEKGIPTPVFLPREFHGNTGAWQATGYRVAELDTTEQLSMQAGNVKLNY